MEQNNAMSIVWLFELVKDLQSFINGYRLLTQDIWQDMM